MISLKTAALLAFVVVITSGAGAQTVRCGSDRVCKMYEVKLNAALSVARGGDAETTKRQVAELTSLNTGAQKYVDALQPLMLQSIANAQFDKLAAKFDAVRTDKQTGSGANANGSTNLVSLPSSSTLVSLAVQSGALTESVNGDTATLRGNLDGIFAKVDGLNPYCPGGCKGWRAFAKNVDASATMNLSASATTNIPTSGAANGSTPVVSTVSVPSSAMRLSGIDVRYVLHNPADPRSAHFQHAFLGTPDTPGLFQQHAAAYVAAAATLDTALNKINTQEYLTDPDSTKLRGQYYAIFAGDLRQQDAQSLVRNYDAYFAANLKLLSAKNSSLVADIGAAEAALTAYDQLNQDIVALAQGVHEFTAGYSYSKPVGQPQTHDIRLIGSYTPAKVGGLLAGGTFTFNAAASIYGTGMPITANYSRLKDVQIAMEFDRPIFGNLATKKAVLSISGYGQYQNDPTVLNITAGNLAPGTNITLPSDAQVLLGTAGWLGIGQIKITITTPSGASIPIGFKWANKTDLLDSNKINGQFGISYDFSSLSQLFGARSTTP